MIKFYNIDENYINYLRVFDNKIPATNYDKHQKFLCGIVLNINNQNYYAPISSNTKVYNTSFPIKLNELIVATIRFSFMIPADTQFVKQLDFAKIAESDKKYAVFLQNEWKACLKNEDKIKKMAGKVYKIGCNKAHRLNSTCCDFQKLEQAASKYLSAKPSGSL